MIPLCTFVLEFTVYNIRRSIYGKLRLRLRFSGVKYAAININLADNRPTIPASQSGN